MSAPQAHKSDFGVGNKTLGTYSIGIALCVLLTLIPFAAVLHPDLSHGQKVLTIFVMAILQFMVQVICFLRLNYSTAQSKINTMALLFSLVILLVIIGGSVWIMWSLNYRMMH